MKQSHGENLFKDKLDATVVDIEFLLISVIQGVALATLSGSAVSIVSSFDLEYWLYIASGFIFILIFWSQAIIHALSFIDWPLDLRHNFFYFLTSFIEVLAFSQMTSPLKWFGFNAVFLIVAGLLYIVDLGLITMRKKNFESTPGKRELFQHIRSGHIFELSVLVPLGIVYSLVAVLLIHLYPEFFLTGHYHVVLIAFQVVFGLRILAHSVHSFRRRAELITKADVGSIC